MRRGLHCPPAEFFSPSRSSRRAGSNAQNPARPGRGGEYSAAERFSHILTRPSRAVFQGRSRLANRHALSKYIRSDLDGASLMREAPLFCSLAQCPCGRDNCARTQFSLCGLSTFSSTATALSPVTPRRPCRRVQFAQFRVPVDEFHVHGLQCTSTLDARQTLCLPDIIYPAPLRHVSEALGSNSEGDCFRVLMGRRITSDKPPASLPRRS